MFKKIVSQLSFSPALVGQLGFYARRLRKEQATRRLGLIFVALALVVQGLVVFQPPEAANASSNNDFITGGLGLGSNRTLDRFVGPYDRNERHLKDIMNYFGITRAEITAAQFTSFTAGSKKSYGYENRAGSTTIEVTDANNTPVQTIYGRNLTMWAAPTDQIYGYVGHSSKIGWFAIMQACGNLVTERFPEAPTRATPKATLAVATTAPKIETSKAAVNISQGNVNATSVTAQESDRISFSITAQNVGSTAAPFTFEDNIGDTLEYSKLIDNGGGSYNQASRKLSWPAITLQPGEKQARAFSVQILSTMPATPRGVSDPSSYDCKIENAFYTSSVMFPVTCPAPKVVEQVVPELPHTGPSENMVFAGVVLAIVTFFYFRSRQLSTEVRLIRRDVNGGAI